MSQRIIVIILKVDRQGKGTKTASNTMGKHRQTMVNCGKLSQGPQNNSQETNGYHQGATQEATATWTMWAHLSCLALPPQRCLGFQFRGWRGHIVNAWLIWSNPELQWHKLACCLGKNLSNFVKGDNPMAGHLPNETMRLWIRNSFTFTWRKATRIRNG